MSIQLYVCDFIFRKLEQNGHIREFNPFLRGICQFSHILKVDTKLCLLFAIYQSKLTVSNTDCATLFFQNIF